MKHALITKGFDGSKSAHSIAEHEDLCCHTCRVEGGRSKYIYYAKQARVLSAAQPAV